MTQKIATVLNIDLSSETFEKKVRQDLWPVIGGIGYALFLLKEKPNSSIISIGPLTGAFAGCDVAYLTQMDKGKKEIVFQEIQGETACSLKKLGWDAIVIEGKTKKPITFAIEDGTTLIIPEKNLEQIKITTDAKIERPEKEGYREIYEKVLAAVSPVAEKEEALAVNMATCLGSRALYQEIYNSIPLAYATLNSLDINYSHEELEEGMEIVYNLL